jgi:hypothetical protein
LQADGATPTSAVISTGFDDMSTPFYAATIFDEVGNDQGPLDMSGAGDDAQAGQIGKRVGERWLVENGQSRATVKITHGSRGLPLIEVHR